MSSRIYPLYQRGNPQLRIFLPNFWMKMVRPEHEQPKNVVQFACSMEMTRGDVKSYLEKIYKVPVVHVRTRIALGKTKEEPGRHYVVKEDDVKFAYVTLPKEMSFEFPDVYSADSEDKQREREDEKAMDEAKESHKKFLEKNKDRPGTPGWYTF